MKRALMAAVFGGLVALAIPQVASASIHHAAPTQEQPAKDAGAQSGSDHAKPADDADHADHDDHGRKQDPPGEGRSHYDREHHDGDIF